MSLSMSFGESGGRALKFPLLGLLRRWFCNAAVTTPLVCDLIVLK